MNALNRVLNPSTNATGLGSLAAAVYAAVVMIWHVAHHQGVIDPQVLVGGAAAIWLFYTRFVVTPVKDPKDGDGHPLVHDVSSAWSASRGVTAPRSTGGGSGSSRPGTPGGGGSGATGGPPATGSGVPPAPAGM